MDLKKVLNDLQNSCNALYAEYGASENVIQLQVAINSLRNEFDVPDETEMTISNEGFVQ